MVMVDSIAHGLWIMGYGLWVMEMDVVALYFYHFKTVASMSR